MSDEKVPAELRYTAEHEWVQRAGDTTVRVGITDYAQAQLGDVVFVQLPDTGAEAAPGTAMGEVESTKSVSDVFAPLADEARRILDRDPQCFDRELLISQHFDWDAPWTPQWERIGKERVANKIERVAGGSLKGKIVAVWGITFKARTDDLRDSPSLEIIRRLLDRGAVIQAYDPSGPDGADSRLAGISVLADPYDATAGAEVLAILTEWDEFKWLDFDKVGEVMAAKRVVDGRNLLDRTGLRRRGFSYEGIGRS